LIAAACGHSSPGTAGDSSAHSLSVGLPLSPALTTHVRTEQAHVIVMSGKGTTGATSRTFASADGTVTAWWAISNRDPGYYLKANLVPGGGPIVDTSTDERTEGQMSNGIGRGEYAATVASKACDWTLSLAWDGSVMTHYESAVGGFSFDYDRTQLEADAVPIPASELPPGARSGVAVGLDPVGLAPGSSNASDHFDVMVVGALKMSSGSSLIALQRTADKLHVGSFRMGPAQHVKLGSLSGLRRDFRLVKQLTTTEWNDQDQAPKKTTRPVLVDGEVFLLQGAGRGYVIAITAAPNSGKAALMSLNQVASSLALP
jgi:hypothetical protein